MSFKRGELVWVDKDCGVVGINPWIGVILHDNLDKLPGTREVKYTILPSSRECQVIASERRITRL